LITNSASRHLQTVETGKLRRIFCGFYTIKIGNAYLRNVDTPSLSKFNAAPVYNRPTAQDRPPGIAAGKPAPGKVKCRYDKPNPTPVYLVAKSCTPVERPAFSATKGDLIAKPGYRNGFAPGLLISATGSAIFWPVASAASYPMFLAALFIVGLGFAMLKITANPYATILGPEKTASSCLNLAQGFNSIGTVIGPLIGGCCRHHFAQQPDSPGVCAKLRAG
jgi:hypothetical protein